MKKNEQTLREKQGTIKSTNLVEVPERVENGEE